MCHDIIINAHLHRRHLQLRDHALQEVHRAAEAVLADRDAGVDAEDDVQRQLVATRELHVDLLDTPQRGVQWDGGAVDGSSIIQ